METCAGCGSRVAPSWRYCIHCGLAVEQPEVPAAIRPDAAAERDYRSRNRVLLLGGIGIFVVGVALLIVAIAMFSGGSH